MSMKKSTILLAMLSLLLCLFMPVQAKAEDGHNNMNIYGIYLGDNVNGDAVLVESDGEYLLMDMGEAGGYAKVKAFLQKMGVEHLSLYLSHMHADHTGGLRDGEGYDQLTQDFYVDKVYVPEQSIAALSDQSWNYEKIVSLYTKNYKDTDSGVDAADNIVYLNVGSTFSFGDVKVKIIGPVGMDQYTSLSQFEEENDYLNSCSLDAQLVCGNTTYLTLGDCELEGEAELIKTYGSQLKADIFKMSHHGYASGNSTDLMAYVQPTYSFALNSGDATAMTDSEKDGTSHRKTTSALDNCSQYGFCYLVGDEKLALKVGVVDDAVKLYRADSSNNFSTAFSGWTKVYGSDGVYEKYDYYYIGSDGKPVTGIQTIDGKKYYLGTGGRRVTGYYKDGSYVPWRKYEDNGTTYQMRYFVQKTGEMATGWLTLNDGTYYLNPDTGYRLSGMQTIKGTTYFFSNAGIMKTKYWANLDDGKRYFNGKGKMVTGFQTVDGNYYYFNSNGILTVGGDDWPLVKIDGNYYAISKSGIVSNSGWRKYTAKKEAKYRYFTPGTGEMKTGWQTVDGQKYYLDSKTGYRATGVTAISGKNYCFNNNGTIAKKKWITVKNGKCYADNKGIAVTGFKTIDKNYYHFDSNGILTIGGDDWPLVEISGKYYAISKSGIISNKGWRKYKVKKNYNYRCFNTKGVMQTGWFEEGSNKYYLDMDTGFRTMGLKEVSGKYYYFSNSGVMVKNKTVTIDGKKYKFGKNGAMTNVPKVSKVSVTSVKAGSQKLSLQWKKVKGADGYEIYISNKKDGTYKKKVTIKSGNAVKGSVAGLTSGKTYYVKVRAYKSIDGVKVYGAYSSIQSKKVK